MDTLAKEFGVTIAQLRDFITGTTCKAIIEYCNLMGFRLVAKVLGGILLGILIIVVVKKFARKDYAHFKKKYDPDISFEDFLMYEHNAWAHVFLFAYFGATVIFMMSASVLLDGIGWLLYPRGMVLDMIVKSFGA